MKTLRVCTNFFPYLFYLGMFGVMVSNRLYHLGRWEVVLEKLTVIGMVGWIVCVAIYFVFGKGEKERVLEEILESTNPFVIPKFDNKKPRK